MMTASKEGRTLRGRDRFIARATQVHHIKHLEDYPELALDDDNLEAVCLHCHNLLHGRGFNGWHGKKRKVNVERW